jgi:hypothetical protein
MAILKESKPPKPKLAKLTIGTAPERMDLITLVSVIMGVRKGIVVERAVDAYIDKSREELIEIIATKVDEKWKDPDMKKKCQGRLDRYLRKVFREISYSYMSKGLLADVVNRIKQKMLFEGEL